MSGEEAREDARRDYQSSLEDLTFNSKPHINMLTILAEENVQFARDIVSLIEAQTAKAPSTEKLPVMYLMDSIVKNVGRDYVAAFAKNIVATFVNVFEKVDENTRKSLYKLRSTWDEIFPSKKLYALDVRVNQVDPAWPVKPLPPNVNTASIHVNPKFLNKPEDSPAPAAPVPNPTPRTPPVTAEVPKPLVSQEQMIRQQLLVKQKQLLELQQKKLELELEQTKAQLANSISSTVPTKPHVVPEVIHPPVKVAQPTSSHPEKNRASLPPSHHDKQQAPIRDPRLNRGNPHSTHSKDQGHKKEVKNNTMTAPEPRPLKPLLSERVSSSSKAEKTKLSEKAPKKDSAHTELKGKSKSPSPLMAKFLPPKEKSQGVDGTKDADLSKRDPRLRKHVRDKPDDKPEEIKDKRKSSEKKEDHKSSEYRPSGSRNKIANGVPQKTDSNVNDSEKPVTKPGRIGNRKRSGSRSPKSRSPVHSPKRRERRSPPKRRQRSISPIPSLLKIGKLRQPGSKLAHAGDFPAIARDDRSKRIPKLDARDNRRPKKASEERQQDLIAPISAKSSLEPKENAENWQGSKSSKRWPAGWEESKNLQNDDHLQGMRSPHGRHRDSWSSNKAILSPRTPKQQPWLSVDADLKIPKELTSASKGELLKKANERLASGEITQDEFLVVAHQIRQLFQYREEKHRCSVWDSPTEEGGPRKKPLLSNAELNYYQHKAKLKRTQVQHGFTGEGFIDMQMDELILGAREMEYDSRRSLGVLENEPFPENLRRLSPLLGTRTQEDGLEGLRRTDDLRERSKGLRDEARPSYNDRYPQKRPRYEDSAHAPFVDDTAPIGKDNLQHGLHEDRRPLLDASPRLPVNRVEGPVAKVFEESSNALNVRESSPVQQSTLFDGPPVNQVGGQLFESLGDEPMDFDPVAGNLAEDPLFETISGQPVNVKEPAMQRFDGAPNQMITNMPMNNQRIDCPPLGPQRFDGAPVQQLGPPRFEGVQPLGPQRFEGGLGRFESGTPPQLFDGHQRFEGGSGPQRFEGSQRFESGLGPQRFDGPQRFEGGSGSHRFEVPQRFDGASRPPLMQQRFEGGQCPPMRFEQPMGQQMRFDAGSGQPMGPMRFDGPHNPRFDGPPVQRFDGPLAPRFDANQPQRFDHGPNPQGLMRFDGPMGQGGPRFENAPVNRFENQQPLMPRFDLPGQPCQRFDGPPGHQTPPRFDGPMQMQPRFDGPMQQRFDGATQQQRFDMPVHQGPRFDNINHPPLGQNAPPFSQTGPFVDTPNMFPGQSQGIQFQRPDQRFDMSQGPGFTRPGVQCFPNQPPRPSGPYFDDKIPQGPAFGNFNMPVGNMQTNPQFLPMGGVTQTAPFNQEPLMAQTQAPNSGTYVPQQPGASFPNPENHLGQLDVNELFSKLLSTGILKVSQTETTSSQSTETSSQPQPEEEEEDPAEDQDVPDITGFPMDLLKQRYESVLVRLYTGIQCYSCGMRFTKSQTDVYADHLDWHYRQNRTEKDVSRKITHRRWYYSLRDWIEFEEIADLEERAKSQFFEKVHEEVILKTQEAAKEKEFQSVPAGPAGADEICEICQEQFEQYWDEEEEEWHLKNAMRVNEKIYHPSCYEDYKNTSSFLDNTPSPSKTLLENPLNAMLSLVKEEVPDTSDATVKVKEEPTDCAATSCGEGIPLLAEIKPEPAD